MRTNITDRSILLFYSERLPRIKTSFVDFPCSLFHSSRPFPTLNHTTAYWLPGNPTAIALKQQLHLSAPTVVLSALSPLHNALQDAIPVYWSPTSVGQRPRVISNKSKMEPPCSNAVLNTRCSEQTQKELCLPPPPTPQHTYTCKLQWGSNNTYPEQCWIQ